MPQSLAWTPPDAMITSVDGHGTFVILHCTDAGLSSLCGVSLRCNKFLDDLLLARNEACDNALEALVATHFTVDTDATSQTKLRALRTRFLQEHPAALPHVVEFNVHGLQLTTPYESDKRRRVAVQMEGDTLTSIVKAIVQEVGTNDRLKKPRSHNQLHLPYPEVHVNSKRNTLYVKYEDADGRERYHAKKLEDDEDDVLRTAEELHAFYLEHNCRPQAAPASADDAVSGEDSGPVASADADDGHQEDSGPSANGDT